MSDRCADLPEIRCFFAQMMSQASQSPDHRYQKVFESVLREDFMPPGPWHIMVGMKYLQTPSADPLYLYQNILVALDVEKGINNGEPFLHALWIGACAPKAGEGVCHIGAGTGYYTAILSRLVSPNGFVHAFEVDRRLARAAQQNLSAYDNVTVDYADAVHASLPASDLIYVNAGVNAPPTHWLRAVRQHGRIIFPWRPAPRVGLALVLTRHESGFTVKPIMPAWFIPCVGISEDQKCLKPPTLQAAWSTRSAWLNVEKMPDETATAIYDQLWFSAAINPCENQSLENGDRRDLLQT